MAREFGGETCHIINAVWAGRMVLTLPMKAQMRYTVSCSPGRVIDHALITWLSCSPHVGDHAMIM